jgi:amino acid efflux transporter
MHAPLVEMAQRVFGNAGRIFTGLLAGIICLGTMNAYMAGLSRLSYSMARAGDLPAFLGKLDSATGTPRYSVFFLLLLNVMALGVQLTFSLPLHNFFLVQNVAFLLLYLLGCLATARLLAGNRLASVAAMASALVCALMLLFAGKVLWYPGLIAAAALARILMKARKHRNAKPQKSQEGSLRV